MTVKMSAPISEATESVCGGFSPGAHSEARAAGALRDWRGMKYHLSSTTDEELLNVLAHAQLSCKEIEQFVSKLQAEWVRRQCLKA
jgi:hypothetical protein